MTALRRTCPLLLLLALVVTPGVANGGTPMDGPPGKRTFVVSVAGDIACGTHVVAYNDGVGTATQCRQAATAKLLYRPDAVWTLGDHVYPTATLAEFRAVYESTWGAEKAVTYPTPGDHDYVSGSLRDYARYFDRKQYYAFHLHHWQVFSLNSEVNHAAHSRQVAWLRQRLDHVEADCIAAFWGAPRWTSGPKGPGDTSFQPFWRALYRAHADLALSGDSHQYERFAPQDPRGRLQRQGIREFVVGTGGRSLVGFPNVLPNSRSRAEAFGLLRLKLKRHSYRWRFVDVDHEVLDKGDASCHS